MAMSLEDLLAEEGFMGRKSKTISRASSGIISAGIPIYPARDGHKLGASVRLRKTERAYSDANRYDLSVESTLTERAKGRQSVDVARREKNVRRSTNDTRERHIRGGSHDMMGSIGSSIDASKQFSLDEMVEIKEGVERVKDGVQDKRRHRDVYLNGVHRPAVSKSKHYNGVGEQEGHGDISRKDTQIHNGHAVNYNNNPLGGISSKVNYQKSVKQPVSSSSRSSISTQNRVDNRNSRVRESVDIEQSVAELALDKLAIKAIISIFSGHTKRIIKDQDFRTSLRHSCLAMLNLTKSEENLISEGKVISNLERAIETVERATEKDADAKTLKKAALQLSVITGLNANGLKDGFTSGISNSMLSACGHLYLSVIYQLQNKERIAARHLLQVFCDSPLSARTTLVPELWDNIFHPHLLHLEEWYNQEVDSMGDDPSNMRKLKKLNKLYDEIIDAGTYQFALYYKDWLTDGVEAPSIPSIYVPLVSFQEIRQGGSLGHSLDFSSPANAFLPQHMVSKKSNDCGCMCKSAAAEVEDHQSAQRLDDGIQSYDGSLVEDKMTTHSLEENEYEDFDIKQHVESHEQDGPVAQEALELYRANALGKFRNAIRRQEGLKSTNMSQSLPIAKVNELTLKMLAKSVFELQQTERSVAVIETTFLPHLDDAPYPDFPQIETKPMGEDLHEEHIGGGRGLIFCDIPQDYLCPLTGLLFEDPVTLENGQTYERVAIAEWFSKGNKACPVTREMLECHNVPHTNFLLNRVIDGWKAKHSRNILASACQVAGSPWEQKVKDKAAIFILEQLLTVFGEGEDLRIAKHLITLGGLHFLIKRFEYGDLDEKTCAAALLSCCIKADSGCRINVTRSIKKQCLLELLHCKGVKSRANAVFLLFELICLNRKKDVGIFLDGLQKGSIMSSMHILLVFLQGCSPEQKPFVAVLLLHLDLLVDQQKYSTYREQAVDTITSALDASFSNEKVRLVCCRALLILGGRISFSGKVMMEDWNLKKAGFLDSPELEVEEDKGTVKDNILSIQDRKEEEAVNDWLMVLSVSLLGDGKKSFLVSLSQCLSSGHRDMMRVCLTTMAWLSSALASLPKSESQLSAFSIVIYQLKENLNDGERIEHKILAAMSLLNFSKIPECRDLLMTIADEIAEPLRDLCDVTWMAKELYALISQNGQ